MRFAHDTVDPSFRLARARIPARQRKARLLCADGVLSSPGPVWLFVPLLLLGLASVAPSLALDLTSAIARARERSPAVQASEHQLGAARANWYQAGRRPNPLAELRSENWRLTPDLRAQDPELDFFATLSQPLELGGKRAARQAVASAGIDVARAEARAVRTQLALETAKHFLAVVRAREELRAIAESEESIRSLYNVAKHRVSEGRLAEAEQLKLETELGRLRTLSVEVRANQSVALQQLRQLLGEPALDPAALEEPSFTVPPAEDDTSLVEQVLRKHPESQAMAAEKERAQHSFELERRRRIPDPTLTAGYKRTAARDTLVAGVLIPVPVFDTNWGNVQRAMAELMAANARMEATDQRLRGELLGLLQHWRALAARVRTARADLLEPAARVRHAARVAFEEGSGDILGLVDAERVYLEVQRTSLAARTEAALAAQTWEIFTQEDDE